MPRFFTDRESLHQFTRELTLHADTFCCPHCQSAAHLRSHGFVYQKQSQAEPRAIGKRVFCSNRCSHQGCGRTQRLYLAEQIPRWHYGTTVLFAFLQALLAGASIQQAYQQVTGTAEARQAYRWLNKLQRQLGVFRQHLSLSNLIDNLAGRPRRLRLLLPTLSALFAAPFLSVGTQKGERCSAYQYYYQRAFA